MRATFFVLSVSTFALAAGCATTGAAIDRDVSTAGAPQVSFDEPGSRFDVEPSFPARLSKAELRAADRLAHRINAEHSGTISAQVKLCVGPSGAVQEIAMLAASGMSEFDQIVIDEVGDWKFAPFVAPTGTRVCENLTVAYQAR